ncbi:MAG: hypothetical protein KIT14_14060 [bacterium]|nr:hypothetical protein [bacterium]
MARHRFALFDPLLSDVDAAGMSTLAARFGRYGLYSQEKAEIEIGDGLAQRHDAVLNFLCTGGRGRRDEPLARLASRTHYFRESYAYGDRVLIPGIEPFLHHEGFVARAREIHDRPVIEPAIVYANVLLPGQELAVHTDVPEFRGANRLRFPQWLMVVMHHSGLFASWRMPIVTGVSWFSACGGGGFAFYPDGAGGAVDILPARPNTAILLDTDSVFHGVDLVEEVVPLPDLHTGMLLVHDGDDRWSVRDGDTVVARYRWNDLRFSVSWKAYCFADEAERTAWREHTDDLTLDTILDRLRADLRARGRLGDERPTDTDLALMLIDEYVRFPAAPPERRSA